ncbi:MAG: hypothetical protein M3N47_08520, partial [Chloroflexota bacterium]|nr:hypothetical protein [Chloroflexota bacterium]
MKASTVVASLAAVSLAVVLCGCGGSDTRGGAGATAGLQVATAGWKTDFSKHTVPLSEFQSGGPGRDGIPPIDEPRTISQRDA